MTEALYDLTIPPPERGTAGKIVVLPSRVNSVWLHNPLELEYGYGRTNASMDDVIFIHSRERQTVSREPACRLASEFSAMLFWTTAHVLKQSSFLLHALRWALGAARDDFR